MGSKGKEPPWVLGGFHACYKRAGRRQSRATRALGQVLGDLLCVNAGQAGGGPRPRSPEQSRRARGLATHNKKLMSAAAWAAGSAVARPRGDGGQRRKRKGEKGQERRRVRRRRGEPTVGGHNLFGFSSSRGRQRGRKWEAHRSNHSMGGEGKGGGEKAALLPAENSRKGRRGPPLTSFSPAPCGPHPRTLARATRAHSAPPPAAAGPSLSGHLCSTGPRPAGTQGLPGRWTPVQPVSRMRQSAPAALNEVGASTPGCQGPAVRDGIATRILPTVSAQQRMRKGYGVSLPVHKNWREFRLVGMVWVWFCQKRGKDLNEFSRSMSFYGHSLKP